MENMKIRQSLKNDGFMVYETMGIAEKDYDFDGNGWINIRYEWEENAKLPNMKIAVCDFLANSGDFEAIEEVLEIEKERWENALE